MGLGQTMITSAFLVLLTFAVMSANRMMVDQDYNYYEQEAFKQGSVIGNALLAEISRKRFDEVVDTSDFGYYLRTSFSTYLGPDPWWGYIFLYDEFEAFSSGTTKIDKNSSVPYASLQYFDDVDDYNGYKRRVNTRLFTGVIPAENAFTVSAQVFYVQESNPNNVSGSQTYLKKVVVSVTHPKYLKAALQFSTIIAY